MPSAVSSSSTLGSFDSWLEVPATVRRRGRSVVGLPGRVGLRFAFYGRARPEHQALLMMLGHQAEREVLCNRFRTSAAMVVQVREQGRNLGGRPPYGYRLADAGPHPKVMHASWGRRQHRLEVDPATAGIVQWMFACRLEGMSTAGIARVLNERGVSSPGGVRP